MYASTGVVGAAPPVNVRIALACSLILVSSLGMSNGSFAVFLDSLSPLVPPLSAAGRASALVLTNAQTLS